MSQWRRTWNAVVLEDAKTSSVFRITRDRTNNTYNLFVEGELYRTGLVSQDEAKEIARGILANRVWRAK